MAIRRFCDVCQEEIDRNYVSERLKDDVFMSGPNVGTTVKVEVTLGLGETWNKGDLCACCAADAVATAFKEAPA